MKKLIASLCLVSLVGVAAPPPPWLGEQMPLQLTVKGPEDLAFKVAAEKQYLIFNLLAGGKVAFDQGDFATAAERWESLLRTPKLPADVEALVKPLAKVARERAGNPSAPVTLPPVTVTEEGAPAPLPKASVTVIGTVTGAGAAGPGGAVVLLRRAEGSTPKPRAARVHSMKQKDKKFIPRVLAVPLGSTVEFENFDEVFHNVFSLSKPNDFDLGLYKSGTMRERKFTSPGPVELLCNIHSSMQATIYVSDTPWFAQANEKGRFSIAGVPPGNYIAEVWHENSAKGVQQKVKVFGAMEELNLSVDGDKRAPAFVPDKSGTPRQVQLGY